MLLRLRVERSRFLRGRSNNSLAEDSPDQQCAGNNESACDKDIIARSGRKFPIGVEAHRPSMAVNGLMMHRLLPWGRELASEMVEIMVHCTCVDRARRWVRLNSVRTRV